jgi:hypothetical protein
LKWEGGEVAGPGRLIRDRLAMLAEMKPRLVPETYVFCSSSDEKEVLAAKERALAVFNEQEGVSLILWQKDAQELGLDSSTPMARIVLDVYSALDGVGLTAGVASALADQGIPCNMVAAYHHDNVFVPECMKDQALSVLEAVQADAACAHASS